MKYGTQYKALFISAALLAAPVAFAEDNHGGMPPPPQGGMVQGSVGIMQGEHDGMMASTSITIHHDSMRRPGEMGTSTDGRPPMMGRDSHGSMMASSTDGRPSMHDGADGKMGGMRGGDRDTGTSTEMDNGTSTPHMSSPIAKFFAHIGAFLRMDHSTSTDEQPPMIDGGDATVSASASTTASAPSHGFVSFLQHFFNFFH